METKPKISLPIENEMLRNQILQVLHEFSVLQLHIFRPKKADFTELFILLQDPKKAEILRARSWIDKAATVHKVNIHISSYQKAVYQLKLGNPFYQYYANHATIVWRGEASTQPLKIHPTKKAYKKKLNAFKEKFYHDHDILLSEAHKFQAREMYAGAFQTYLTLFEHHTQYLENLCTGWINFDTNLHARLLNLIRYIPELQKVFVMKNRDVFYLLSKMEKVLKEARSGEEAFVSVEIFNVVKAAETQLLKMVADRFTEFNKIIKFKKPPCTKISVEAVVTRDPRLEIVLDSLVRKWSPEEIYLFHKKESASQNVSEPEVLYYFLVIGDGISNETIVDVQQSIEAKSAGKVNAIILGHSRFTIQDRLSASQNFIQTLTTSDNLLYASHEYLPQIHWQNYTDCFGDLSIYYSRMTKTVSHYFTLRSFTDEENAEVLLSLFFQAMMRLLRLYLYCSLCSYLPKTGKMLDTWKLCVYVDPSLEKIEFLFDKLNPDFFKLADSFLKYTDRSYLFNNDELLVMDEILNILQEKLKVLIKENNLTGEIN